MPAFLTFLTGILVIVGELSVFLSNSYLLFIVIPLIFLILIFQRKRFVFLNILIIVTICSVTYLKLIPYRLPAIPDEIIDRDISIKGKVLDFSTQRLYPQSFEIGNIEIDGIPYSSRIKVYSNFYQSFPGSTVLLNGRIKKSSYLTSLSRFTHPTHYISVNNIEVLSENNVFTSLGKVRERIIERVKLSMKSDEAFLLLSSIMGASSLSSEERAPFESTGTAHIFAISGLHMSILGEFLNSFLRLFTLLSPVITILILVIYNLMLGFNVSALRSVFMYGTMSLARVAGRPGVPLNTLGFAGIIILIFSPLSILSVSFQLSFMAVFALFVVSPLISRFLGNTYLFRLLSGVIAIQVLLIPMMSYYFGTVSLSAFIANIAVIPFMNICVPVGFIQVLCAALSKPVSGLFSNISNPVYSFLNSMTTFFSRFPLSSLGLRMNLAELFIYYSVVFVFLIVFYKKVRFQKSAI